MGEVFAGRYELADPIGRGGVGAVWRAWDHRRRRYVAAKVLQQRDAHSLLRFVREQALRIDHPHVLAPASWAADDDQVLFTMDLVAGGSLVHLVGDYGPLPPAFVRTLLDQLLSGLAAVHAEGVVHRDIKPANILLEATGTARPRLRLSDFGIAMRLGEPRLTETNLVVGTPGYLAPEQIMGAEPDFRADLFAVGLVALYLLQGAKPDAKALVEHFAEHGTPGAPVGVPEPLWQVVATLLQPDPEARFRTATGARKALASAAELLDEPGPDDELIEIFDQLGPLPPGFGPEGPLRRSPGVNGELTRRDGAGDDTGSDGGGTSGAAGVARSEAAGGAGGVPGGGTGGATGSVTGSTSGRTSGNAPGTFTGSASGSGTGRVSGNTSGSGPGNASGHAPGSASRRDPGKAPGSVPGNASESTPWSDPEDAPGGVRRGTGSVASDPRLDLQRDSDRPATMSDTGSFHLPPPLADPAPVPSPSPHPASSPQDTTHTLRPAGGPPPPPVPPRADPVTAAYTAEVAPARAPAPAPAPEPVPARGASRHRARRLRRPGPPAKVALPLLLLALACYAVGFWALARI
ncbi:serine/threonine-protein kinase [Streptomyces anandii]|uniref:serine/threonine-protein kinase n=1 Tax=Streptomyces anandii TaxID=285454 RepID=UPI0036FFDF28